MMDTADEAIRHLRSEGVLEPIPLPNRILRLLLWAHGRMRHECSQPCIIRTVSRAERMCRRWQRDAVERDARKARSFLMRGQSGPRRVPAVLLHVLGLCGCGRPDPSLVIDRWGQPGRQVIVTHHGVFVAEIQPAGWWMLRRAKAGEETRPGVETCIQRPST